MQMIPNSFPQKTFSPVTRYRIANLATSRNSEPGCHVWGVIGAGKNKQNSQWVPPSTTMLSKLPNLPGAA